MDRVTAATLRFRLFTIGGIISYTCGRATIRLAVLREQRLWWQSLNKKLLGVLPNCSAIPACRP